MREIIVGRADFIALKQFVDELRGTTAEANDILVVLVDENFTVSEVRYIEPDLVFFGYSSNQGKHSARYFRGGDKISVVVERPASGVVRRITMFLEQSA